MHSPLNRGGCGLDANLAPPFQHCALRHSGTASTCAKARLYSAQALLSDFAVAAAAPWQAERRWGVSLSTKLVSCRFAEQQ